MSVKAWYVSIFFKALGTYLHDKRQNFLESSRPQDFIQYSNDDFVCPRYSKKHAQSLILVKEGLACSSSGVPRS